MTKAVKVFNGQVTNSTTNSIVVDTTIYTVPAGRVAKVSVSYFHREQGTSNASTFRVGNYSTWQINGGGAPAFVNSGGASVLITGSNTMLSGTNARNNVAVGNAGVWPTDIYLVAGQTVVVGLPGDTGVTTSFTYSLMVVEEY